MEDNKKEIRVDDRFDDAEFEDTLKERYLIFRLEKEDYGIEIVNVTEIVGLQRITMVPGMPDFVKGVINLRGKVIPVIDVRTRFHMKETPYNDRTCVIVVNIGEKSVGLVVDTVKEVLTIPESQITAPPQMQNQGSKRHVRGLGRVGEDVKILLDVNQLLGDGELSQISAITTTEG